MESKTIEEMLDGPIEIRRKEDTPEPSPVRHIKPENKEYDKITVLQERRFRAAKILAKLPDNIKENIIGTLNLVNKPLPSKIVNYVLLKFGNERRAK